MCIGLKAIIKSFLAKGAQAKQRVPSTNTDKKPFEAGTFEGACTPCHENQWSLDTPATRAWFYPQKCYGYQPWTPHILVNSPLIAREAVDPMRNQPQLNEAGEYQVISVVTKWNDEY